MEYVCDSEEPNCKWYYDATEQRYWLKDSDGNGVRRIKGDYLPNPADLVDSKVEAFKHSLKIKDDNDIRLLKIRQDMQPTTQVKSLWEHWQGVSNA